MKTAANLSDEIWPETWTAAAYLHNKTPSHRNDWKSSIEVFNAYMMKHDISFNENPKDLRPDWSGIFVYDAKAYLTMTKYKRKNMKKHFKINERTHIGYFVKYRASNIYRIWMPKLREILITRNVTFQEDEFFDPNREETGIPIEKYRPAAEILKMPDFEPFDSPFKATLEDELDESEETQESESQSSGGGTDIQFRPLTPISMPEQVEKLTEQAEKSTGELVAVTKSTFISNQLDEKAQSADNALVEIATDLSPLAIQIAIRIESRVEQCAKQKAEASNLDLEI